MQPPTTESITAYDAGTVAEFAAGDDDILVLARHSLPPVGQFIEKARFHEYLVHVNRETVTREVRFGMHELRVQSKELEADICGLVNSFLELFGQEQARLRIEVTRSQSCPKFHCDNVHIRLVTTYFGPTTEYQYSGEDLIHTTPLYGMVFLKGRKHPTHRNSVYHRSPEIPAEQKRLCVAIDY